MGNAPRVLAVIPARGGSKGLPGKNLRPLLGVPLIAYTVQAGRQSGVITRAIVTTDSPEIADVARRYGGDVPFLRPPELAEDTTPMAPVLKHALTAIEQEEGSSYDMLLLLDPTSPARRLENLEQAVTKLAAAPGLDGVIAVSEPTFHPSWVGVREVPGGDRLERYYTEGQGVVRRQDVPRYLRISGNFYVWRSEFVRRLQESWFDEGVYGMVEIPEKESFSIDDDYEFRLVESLVGSGVLTLPDMAGPAHQ